MDLIESMISMENIEPIWKETVSNVPTTITLKLGIKHRLDDLGRKNDTYEDIIIRLINDNARLKRENDHLSSLLEKISVKNINLFEKYTLHRQFNSLGLSNDIYIKFSYDLPDVNLYGNHSFNLRIEEIIWKNSILQGIEELTDDMRSITKIHLWLISKIIIDEYDPWFDIPKKKNIIDPIYWKKVWKRVGLSMESYNMDIMGIINNYQEKLNE